MTTGEFLTANGWRLIGTSTNGYGLTKYWDHPHHQPVERGAFTTSDAIAHQKESQQSGCDCIHMEKD